MPYDSRHDIAAYEALKTSSHHLIGLCTELQTIYASVCLVDPPYIFDLGLTLISASGSTHV